jgi:hypothetical protein
MLFLTCSLVLTMTPSFSQRKTPRRIASFEVARIICGALVSQATHFSLDNKHVILLPQLQVTIRRQLALVLET